MKKIKNQTNDEEEGSKKTSMQKVIQARRSRQTITSSSSFSQSLFSSNLNILVVSTRLVHGSQLLGHLGLRVAAHALGHGLANIVGGRGSGSGSRQLALGALGRCRQVLARLRAPALAAVRCTSTPQTNKDQPIIKQKMEQEHGD